MTDIKTIKKQKVDIMDNKRERGKEVDKQGKEGTKYLHGLYYCNIYGNVFISISLMSWVDYKGGGT